MEERPLKEEESVVYMTPSRSRKVATALVLLGLCAVLAYAFRERLAVKQLVASRDELSAALNQDQRQIQTLTQKLLAAESAPPPAPQPSLTAPAEQQAPIAQPRRMPRYPRRRTAAVSTHHAEDAWHQQVQSQLFEQQKLIAEHQREIQQTQDAVEKNRTDLESNLQSARADLGGSIAKNHDELVALEKKGERNFYEFDLVKSKQFQREGHLRISLRKSNTKHEYCDLVMIVNDSEVSKKHVNLYEPVLFYPEGYSQPLQVVINGIGKHDVRGYVSEPRYKPSELAASASPSGGTASETAGQTAPSSSTEAPALKHRPQTQE